MGLWSQYLIMNSS